MNSAYSIKWNNYVIDKKSTLRPTVQNLLREQVTYHPKFSSYIVQEVLLANDSDRRSLDEKHPRLREVNDEQVSAIFHSTKIKLHFFFRFSH